MNTSTTSQVWYYEDYAYSFNGTSLTISNNTSFSSDDVLSVPRYLTYVNIISQTVIGLIGNVISLIVWTRGNKCSKLACSTYFQLLAISDIFSLISACFYLVIPSLFHNSINTIFEYPALCGVILLNQFPVQLSNGIVVCISVERFLNLVFPFSFSPRGAKCRAKISFVVLLFVMMAVNGYVIALCSDPWSYFDISVTWSEISRVWVLVVVPFSLTVTTNILILVYMCCKNLRSNFVSRKQHCKRIAVFTKLTFYSSMLLAISLFPTLINGLNVYYNILNWDMLQTVTDLTFNTLYINNCFNFLVYCFSGPTFRSDVKFLFRRSSSRT